jgi:EAL domain-containing protein (putative c-di-GMP-specific phosphodiesterase class I)
MNLCRPADFSHAGGPIFGANGKFDLFKSTVWPLGLGWPRLEMGLPYTFAVHRVPIPAKPSAMSNSPNVPILNTAPPNAVLAGVVSDSPHTEGPRTTQALWFLCGQTAEGEAVRHVPIYSFPFRVGRRADVTLSLAYKTVSSLHAEIVECEAGPVLRDLGSTNGTFVNGLRINGELALAQNDLVQFADVPFRVRRQSSEACGGTLATRVCDYALALVQFDQLMAHRAVIPAFQPIVDLRNGQSVGYEALGRSSVFGLEMPGAMFQAATQLDLQVELSRMFRWEAVRASSSLENPPHLFLNTHPAELNDPGLVESLQGLRNFSPRQPITLEIHESAATDETKMRVLQKALKDLDMKWAYDDFGAGQDRLAQLVEVRPDFIKFDMGLIRGIDRSAERQSMLATLVKMVVDLGIVALAEGIETANEGAVCRQIGFQLAQGFHYGKPARANSFEAAWQSGSQR